MLTRARDANTVIKETRTTMKVLGSMGFLPMFRKVRSLHLNIWFIRGARIHTGLAKMFLLKTKQQITETVKGSRKRAQ